MISLHVNNNNMYRFCTPFGEDADDMEKRGGCAPLDLYEKQRALSINNLYNSDVTIS